MVGTNYVVQQEIQILISILREMFYTISKGLLLIGRETARTANPPFARFREETTGQSFATGLGSSRQQKRLRLADSELYTLW